MKGLLYCLLATSYLFSFVLGDLYLHQPRGSNNRLTESSATRANGNRLFDSQNNARGGYNAGVTTADRNQNNEDNQYRMMYFQSGEGNTELIVEWTNQHGCGGDENTSPHKLNCNLVLQFMCQDETVSEESMALRNGQETNTQDYQNPSNDDESKTTVVNRRSNNVVQTRGFHESWEWYDNCYRRERNKGLFTADQELDDNNLGVSSAVFTRQNPNNNDRRGYECPEERDYYPYFHPTPWVDIVIMAHNESSCSYYRENSFNHRKYGECVEQFSGNDGRKHWSSANNPEDCADAGGEWVEYYNFLELAPNFRNEAECLRQNEASNGRVQYMWGKPYNMEKIINHVNIDDVCFVLPPPLDCKAADSTTAPILWGWTHGLFTASHRKILIRAAEWSRVNHLGNGRDLTPLNYTWNLPHFPSGDKKKCVFRMRYNITTDDYDPFNTNASHNEIKEGNVVVQRSPIEQDPLVNIGARQQPLQLAINTNQTGRVFQDRSHVFYIAPRPNEIADDVKVLNLNVRGKRGNIVQVYPAVEYDFVPNRLVMDEANLLHIQWTGSNTHDNDGSGGDGQTGDDGEGTDGTDRNNLVPMLFPGDNYPTPWDNKASLYQNLTLVWSSLLSTTTGDRRLDAAVQLASSGYFQCTSNTDCGNDSVENKAALDNLLNNATPTFKGMVVRIDKGTYHYMCTRNNNFSNRSQKGQITVK